MTTARDQFQPSFRAALSKYKENIAAGMWVVTADQIFHDAVLKAADRYALGAAAMRRLEATRIEAALARVKAEAAS